MARDRAAYMRAYRFAQKDRIGTASLPSEVVADLLAAQDRIQELEAEVARLKRELAARAEVAQRWSASDAARMPPADVRPGSFTEYRPAPKSGSKR